VISCLIVSSHEFHNVNTDMFLHGISKTNGRNMFEFCIYVVNCKLSDSSFFLRILSQECKLCLKLKLNIIEFFTKYL